ncbi:MAG: carbohydrate ABC transporter permease [Spirochaetales bacterium]
MKSFKKIEPPTILKHSLFVFLCALCIYPLLLVLGISFSDELEIARNGFSIFPTKISTRAYEFLFTSADTVIRAYLLTIFVTIIGTILSTMMIAMFAYPLSRKDFGPRKVFNGAIVLTLLFSGGLIPWFIVCVNILHINDTILALILPYLMSPWYVVIMRTFFKSSIPDSIIESAKMDGAGELRIFFRIVIQLAAPGMATIALFNTIVYWNDYWINMTLINDPNLFNLQFLMYRVQANIQYLSANAGNLGTAAAEVARNLPSRSAQMAMTVIAIGPIVLAYPFFQRFFVQGITIGSLKE